MNQTPDSFIFMKIGAHAGESLEAIMERKQLEIERVGKTFWGYGGSTCHPLRQVQPFARSLAGNGAPVLLLMEYIHSVADPKIVPATQFSQDGVNWEPVPDGINVTGSKYAIVLDEIVPGELEIPFNDFGVAVGNSIGTSASKYLRGRVDKACLTKLTPKSVIEEQRIRKISYIGRIVHPYGILLK